MTNVRIIEGSISLKKALEQINHDHIGEATVVDYHRMRHGVLIVITEDTHRSTKLDRDITTTRATVFQGEKFKTGLVVDKT